MVCFWLLSIDFHLAGIQSVMTDYNIYTSSWHQTSHSLPQVWGHLCRKTLHMDDSALLQLKVWTRTLYFFPCPSTYIFMPSAKVLLICAWTIQSESVTSLNSLEKSAGAKHMHARNCLGQWQKQRIWVTSSQRLHIHFSIFTSPSPMLVNIERYLQGTCCDLWPQTPYRFKQKR